MWVHDRLRPSICAPETQVWGAGTFTALASITFTWFVSQNLLQLVALQTRQKHLQAVKDGRYVFLSRPGALTGPNIEHRRLEKRLDIISNILAQAMKEHPEFWDTLLKVSQALTHRALVPWPS